MSRAYSLLIFFVRWSIYMIACICICMCLLTTLQTNVILGAEEVGINTIAASWARRQESVRSFKCSWKNTVIIPKGTVKLANDRRGSASSVAGGFFPEKDTTLEETNALIVQNDNWRYESDDYGISSSRREFVSQHSLTVLKDGIAKCYMLKGIYAYPLGNIVRMKETDYPQDLTARPLFLVFRSLKTGLFKKEKFNLLQNKGIVEGHSCLLLQTVASTSPKCCFWVDSMQDYLPRRYTLSDEQGKVYIDITISYSAANDNRWWPSNWKIVNVNEQGNLIQSITSTVTEIGTHNSSNEQDFEINFPPGTKVRDFRNKTAKKKLIQYIAREGGEKRLITRDEWHASYEELLNTESGQAIPGQRRWPLASKWLWFVSIGIFCGCFLLVFLRRIRNKRITRL